MTTPNQTTIRCAACNQPFAAQVRVLVDAQADPQGKALLVSGRLNQFPCPHCGYVNHVLAPVLYHDPAKELLIACVPMEVSMRSSGTSEEKIVGDLLNELTRTIPKEQFRAYMFSPKRALTMQGLIDQIMEADGITPDMVKAHRARVELIQKLLEANDEVTIKQLIEAHDSEINQAFFQTVTAMGQRLAMEGRDDIAQLLADIQQDILMYSSFGRELAAQRQNYEAIVREVFEATQALPDDATYDDLIAVAVRYADDDVRLQVLVSLMHKAFDEDFFARFTQLISKAPLTARDKLQFVYERIKQLLGMIQEQDRQVLERAAQFLQILVKSPKPRELIDANIELIDNHFMAVLTTNIEDAQRRQDLRTLNALQEIYQHVLSVLQEHMPSELRFINELLGVADDATMQQMIAQQIGDYDEGLLSICDEVEKILAQQGHNGALDRLARIRELLQQHLS